MDKKIIFLLFFLVLFQLRGQTLTVTPASFNEDEEITITVSDFDPQASWGVPDIYLWAWYFDSNGDFAGNSPQIGNDFGNSPATALFTDNGDGTYSFTFTPTTFYEATGITRIGFLIKSQDGSNQSGDNLVDVGRFQAVLNTPATAQTIVDAAETLEISATATVSSDFTLSANGSIIDTATGITEYTNSIVINESTSFVLAVTDGTSTQNLNFSALVRPTVVEEALPNGLVDGLNRDPNDATKATLVLFAPDKEFIHIIGDFNTWEIDADFLMKKDSGQNRFWLELTGLTPQFDHMYQYLIEGTIRVADPYSEIILDEFNDAFINENGNIVYPDLPAYPTGQTDQIVTLMRLGDLDYVWQTTDFQRPEVSDLVIYELLIRDFDELHSFDAVRNRLDYLVDLGVNAIELMPVSEFDGNISWGYNPAFHMALDKYYGDKDAFKTFVDACHARGIAVILDVVYNQATGQNPYFRMYNECGGDFDCPVAANNPFFNVEDPNTAFQFFNDLNHESEATQAYVDRLNRFWLEEYNIDGYRFDFTKGFTNTPGDGGSFDQARIDILTRMYDEIRAVDESAYVILEHFAPNEEETILINHRATTSTTEFGMLVWGNHNFNYNEATLGFHANGGSDFSSISYLNRGWQTPSNVSYMESHDEERLMFKNLQFGNAEGSYNIQNLSTALDRQKLAGAFYFTVPGPKMIWQFGELGYEFSINRCPDGSISDNCRTDPKPIAFTLGYDNTDERSTLFKVWQSLIQLKLNEPIFNSDSFTLDLGADTGLKKIHLVNDSATGQEIKNVAILGNFGVVAQDIQPEFQTTGVWYNILNGNSTLEVTDVNASIRLAPGEFIIFADQPSSVLVNDGDSDNDGVLNENDSCPNTPFGRVVGADGCEVINIPVSNFTLKAIGESCNSSDNGSIEITTALTLDYEARLVGNGIDTALSFTDNTIFTDLTAGAYELCIRVANIADFEQCFTLNISQPDALDVSSVLNAGDNTVTLFLKGAESYSVELNGSVINTDSSTLTLPLDERQNNLKISTDLDCQGVYTDTILSVGKTVLHPNPVRDGLLTILLSESFDDTVTLVLHTATGQMIFQKKYESVGDVLEIDMSSYNQGLYMLTLQSAEATESYKILRQ